MCLRIRASRSIQVIPHDNRLDSPKRNLGQSSCPPKHLLSTIRQLIEVNPVNCPSENSILGSELFKEAAPSRCVVFVFQFEWAKIGQTAIQSRAYEGSAPHGWRWPVGSWPRHGQRQSTQVRAFLIDFGTERENFNIADLQKMAVAEWLQSFNSVRGPMERLGII